MAQMDYEEICKYLKQYSNRTVLNFKTELKDKMDDLKISPYMYQCIDINKNYYIRRIVMKNYIIIYKILDETIEILRILSQKTNYLSQENKNEILNRK